MDLLLPKLAAGLLLGSAASMYAISQGYGLLASLLIYSVAGQVVILLLAGVDLLRGSWSRGSREDRDRETFAATFADELAKPGTVHTQ